MIRIKRVDCQVGFKIHVGYLDIIDFLNEIAPVPEVLQETIMNEKNLDTLKRWLKLAVKSTSIEEFSKNM